MIGLYYCRLPENFSGITLPALTAYRQQRLATLQNERARRQSLGAELMLYRALQDWAPELPWPPELLVDSQGKPRLKEGDLFFSLSHSGSWAACAVARQELGLDIQEKRLGTEALMNRCFTAEEREFVRRSPDPAAAFTELWCKKESRIKAVGGSIFDGLSSFSVLDSPWEYRCGSLEGLFYAVCIPGSSGEELEIHRIELL